MLLNIKNFKSIRDATYNFNKNLTLITGDSGTGKTTIFESIKWCLYSSSKSVFPLSFTSDNKKEKGVTYVIIKTNDLIIKRSYLPNILEVTSNNIKYKDEEAQNIINERFGEKKIWETTSYISQDSMNYLLCSSKQEKTEMIKKLLFEDIDIFDEDKIIREIKILRDEYEKQNNEKELLSKNLKEFKEKYQEEIESYNENLDVERPDFEQKIKEYEEKNKGKAEYDCYIKKLDTIKIKDEEKLKELIEIEKIKSRLENLRVDRPLMKKVAEKFKDIPGTLYENKKKLNIILNGIEKCKKLKIEYDENLEDVKKYYIEKLERNIIYERKNKLRKYEYIIKELNLNKDNLNNNYDKIKNYDKIYECPECHKRLKLDNNKLIYINYQCSKNKNIYKDFLDNFEYIKEFLNLPEYEKEDVYNDYNQIKDVVFINYDLELLKKEIEELEYYTKNYSVLREREELLKKVKINNDYKDLDLESEYEKLKEINYNLKRIDKYKDHVIDEDKLIKYKKLKQDYENNEIYKKLNDTYFDMRNRYNLVKKSLNDKEKKIDVLNKIKDIVITTINENIMGKITNINCLLGEILSNFLEGFKVEITMFKELKNKKIKPEFDLKIENYGLETTFSDMSGGERDRLSIALTLCLNIINDSSFLILDESMKSLNKEFKMKITECIKNYLNGKLVLNVCHDIIEGQFDNIIRLS